MTDLPPLATVSDLETRLGFAAGTLTGADLARAQAALTDVSYLVRAESGRNWLDDSSNPVPPPAIKVVVLQATMRVYSNPDNYTSESVGDYSYQREQGSTSIYLTPDEMDVIRAAAALAGGSSGTWTGVGSVPIGRPYRWRTAYNPWRDRCGDWRY